MYTVRLEKKVRKFLDSIREKERKDILAKFEKLAENPFKNPLDIKK